MNAYRKERECVLKIQTTGTEKVFQGLLYFL